MNVYMEVSLLLDQAQEASWRAKQKKHNYAERDSFYKIKASRISAAVLKDPDGWFLDGYEEGSHILSITYRGCWWFHIDVSNLPETVSAILFSKNVTWLRRGDGNAGASDDDDRSSWPVPDPKHFFRNGYHVRGSE